MKLFFHQLAGSCRLYLSAKLRMLIAVILCMCISCNNIQNKTKPAAFNAGIKSIVCKNGIYYNNDKLLTGYLFSLYPGGDTAFSKQIINGKENGWSKRWYANDQLAEERYFENAEKEGNGIGYWSNGEKKFSYHYHKDMFEGLQQQWFSNGKICAGANFKNGREEGLQQVWDSTGKLLINYVASNERNYGNIGKKNCRSVWKNDSFTVAR
jgi:antitoxin component YwqK of YwqJK toxin-antitoxin module